MSDLLIIQQEAPDTPDALTLIGELDEFLNARYAPEDRHGLSVTALLDPSVIFFVARFDGIPVGCGAIKLMPEGYAEVKRMYVRPERRGKGVARAVLGALEQELTRHSLHVLRLETGIYQSDAIWLYEKAGFAAREKFGDYQDTGISVFYEKTLT